MTIESGPTERESFEADSPRSIKEAVENIDRLSDEAAISLAEELLSAFDREVLKVEGDNEQVKFELKKERLDCRNFFGLAPTVWQLAGRRPK